MPRYPNLAISRYNGSMDSNPPTEPNTPQTPDEAWRRFTILDLLILFCGHVAALVILICVGSADDFFNDHLAVPPLFSFLVLGGGISIPLIFLVQFFALRRRARLSAGEIYAVSNVACWIGVYFALLLFVNAYVISLILWAVIFLFFCSGGIMLFVEAKRDYVPCRWMSFYGHCLNILSILALVALFFMFFNALEGMGGG